MSHRVLIVTSTTPSGYGRWVRLWFYLSFSQTSSPARKREVKNQKTIEKMGKKMSDLTSFAEEANRLPFEYGLHLKKLEHLVDYSRLTGSLMDIYDLFVLEWYGSKI